MFKRELKYNFNGFIIWSLICIGIFLVIFLIYPSITNSENIKSMDEMMNAFPKELLEAFNMDLGSMQTVYGWLKTEGFVFILLILGCYAGMMGGNILLKEESDKTIEYANSLPVTRTKIVIDKFMSGLIYVIGLILVIGLFNYIGLLLSGDFDEYQYLLLSITPIFSCIVIYSICMFISTFMHKSKVILGTSIGIVFMSYIFNAISGITDSVEALKYISIFTLSDVRNVLLNNEINIIYPVVSIILTITFLLLTIRRYENKNLV